MSRLSIAVAVLAVAACGDGGGDPEASWQMIREGEPASLLSIWGESESDVWVAGGRAQLDGGPTVLHYQDAAWTRVDTGQSGVDLWWVFGFEGGDVFFSGSGGTILRYREGEFEKMTTPRDGVIFGMWGAAPDDLWAVGDGGDAGGIVWRYDGETWSEVELPDGVPSRVFKVHGQSADEVWIACADGVTLHWQGSALEREETGIAVPLFSVVTAPGEAIAVGGAEGEGDIVVRDGDGWSVEATTSQLAWRGAAIRDDSVYAVGELGAVAQRGESGWTPVEQPLTSASFHAAWVDPDGGLWGVGGKFENAPLTIDGFLLYHGARAIESLSP